MATSNILQHPTASETVTIRAEKLRDWLQCSDCSDAILNAYEVTEDFLTSALSALDKDETIGEALRARYELELHRTRRDATRHIKAMADTINYLRDEIGALLLHPTAEKSEEVAAE